MRVQHFAAKKGSISLDFAALKARLIVRAPIGVHAPLGARNSRKIATSGVI